MTTLARMPRGARGKIGRLPSPHSLAKRLVALGLNPGAEVCVLQNRGSGPLIVEVHGARLALGRGQADRVTVEPVPGSPCALDEAADE
jgi:Fe2+ transport system protein FeoA